MKKRRELDALVSGKQSSNGGVRLTPKNGKHELLRNVSESSDAEEFSLPEENAARKRGARSVVCLSCVTVLWVFLLVSCVIAVSGLFFLHFKLKVEVDLLRHEASGDKLQQLSEEINELKTAQVDVKNSVKDLEKGDKGITKLLTSVSLLFQQVSALNATTRGLSESIASTSQIHSLPQQFTDLSKNLASIGSNVQTLQGDVKTLLDFKTTVEQKIKNLDDKILTMQLESVSKVSPAPENLPLNTTQITKLLTSVNESVDKHLTEFKKHTAEQDMVVTELKNLTSLMSTRLTFLELKSSESSRNDFTNVITNTVIQQIEKIHNSSDFKDLSDIKNLLLNVQEQCDNDSVIISELKNELSRVSGLADLHIQSAGSKFQYLNDTVDSLLSLVDDLHKKEQKQESGESVSTRLSNNSSITSPSLPVSSSDAAAFVKEEIDKQENLPKPRRRRSNPL